MVGHTVAVGTAILSTMGMHPYPMETPEHVLHGSRFSDAIVNIGCGIHAYICAIYGPPLTQQIYVDGERVFLDAAQPGIQRACAFRGPAIITGDFNRDLCDVVFWQKLRSLGWVDCAEHAFELFGQIPQPTCRDSTRRSFILVNAMLAPLLIGCAICDEFQFDSHPVLEASFDIGSVPLCRRIWSLPQSINGYMFDDDEILQHSKTVEHDRGPRFQQSIENGDTTEAMKQFALAFEEVFQQSAFDVEGYNQVIPISSWGRCRNKVTKIANFQCPNR